MLSGGCHLKKVLLHVCITGMLLGVSSYANATDPTWANAKSLVFDSTSNGSGQACNECHSTSTTRITTCGDASTWDWDTYSTAATYASTIASWTSSAGGAGSWYMPLDPSNSCSTTSNPISTANQSLLSAWASAGAPKDLPTATTGSNSVLSTTKATVYGSVNTNTLNTPANYDGEWYFEYGTTSASASGPVGTTIRNSLSAATVSMNLSGLVCGTGYSYQVVAVNGAKTVTGGTGSFTTTSCSQTTLAASSGYTTSYTISENTSTSTLIIKVTVTDTDGSTQDWGFTSSVNTTSATTSIGSVSLASATTSTTTSTTTASNTITYSPTQYADGNDSFTVYVKSLKGNNNTASLTFNIIVNAVNQTPVVTPSITSESYKGNDPAMVVDSNIGVSDIDFSTSTNTNPSFAKIQSAAVTLTKPAGDNDPGETLGCGATVPSTIACTVTAGNLSFAAASGQTPVFSDFQTALRSVTYVDPNANTTTGARTVAFQVTDASGITGGPPSGDTSTAGDITVNTATASAAPTIDSGYSSTSTSFIENTPVVIDSSVQFSDTDSADLNQVQFTLTTNYDSTQDLLVCPSSSVILSTTGSNTISCTYNAPTLTLQGTDSKANYDKVAQLVEYNNISNNPGTNSRTVQLVAQDSTYVNSTAQNRTITITPVNDPPVITSTAPSAATVVLTEGQAYTNIYSGLTVKDPDDSSFTYRLSGSLSGEVTSTGTTGDMTIDPATGQISWTPPRTGIFNNPTATVTLTVTDKNASGASNGPQSTTQTFNLATSPPDSDGDGVPDYSDNCPTVANPSQADMDKDTVYGAVDPSGIPATGDVVAGALDANGFVTGGDACDQDIDGDGMPNTYETKWGLNPYDPSDASIDSSGDGLTNLQEYRLNPNVDPFTADQVPPVVTAPADVTVNATGYLTDVDLGTASASDGSNGNINIIVPIIDATISTCSDLSNYPLTPPPFRPGLHEANWTTCDSSGNLAYATQKVQVVPILNATAGQTVGAGQTAVVEFMLNGPAVTYPVTVDYQLGGTASSSDYDITSGTLSINQTDVDGNAPGLVGKLTIHIANSIANDETLSITLSNPVNAVLGAIKTAQINIVNHDTTPVLTSTVSQNGAATGQVVYANAGPVVLTVNTSDTNPATVPGFDWSMSDNTINGIGSVVNTANSSSMSFDPSGLAPGLYPIVVTVNDNGKTDTRSFLLKVDATAPNLGDCNLDGVTDVPANNDCDGDGISNTVEGAIDSNANGIPNYLDDNRITESNVIQNETGDPAKTEFIMTDPGLKLRLGTTALASGDAGVLVSQQNINSHGGKDGAAGVNPQDSYINDGGFYDFEVTGLTDAITSAHVVIPLQSAILNDAVYRKYNGSAWSSFVVDANNTISSAPGIDGVCPAPGSSDYKPGLSPLDYCVELTIQDGGPNDADGVRNYVIRDPGGAATPTPAATPAQDTTRAGTGVVSPLLLLLMLAVFSLLLPYRRREVSRRSTRTE